MENLLERMVDLCTPAKCFGEGRCAYRHDHEFLEVNVVVGVSAAIQDVHHGRRQQVGVNAAYIFIERKLSRFGGSLCSCKRNAQDRIRAEVPLVLGAVELDHGCIDRALIVRFEADKSISDLIVHMRNRLERAFAEVAFGIAIAQLDRFECARGSA